MEKMNEIRLFSRTLIRRATKEYEMSTQHLDLLSQLIVHEEGMTPIKLSKVMCVNKTIISRLIDSLSQSGYVTKKSDLKDKRSYKLCITDDGRAIVDKIFKFYLGPIYTLRKKLGDEEFYELISCIENANRKMNEDEEIKE